jgi:hypothetical protein
MELPDFWYPYTSSRPFLRYYRTIFLDAVKRRATEVLQSLRTFVFEKLGPDTDQERLLAQWTERYLKKRFHLTDDWIGFYVKQTLELWSTSQLWFQDIGWPAVRLRGLPPPLPETLTTFVPPTLRWDLGDEPWSTFEKRASAEFAQSLKEYRRQMTKIARSHGFEEAPRKRSRDGRNPLLAFDWLAMWQVCGWTLERIAAEFDTALDRKFLKKDAIMDQIRWAADAIELTLREPTRPGRPPRDLR